MKKSLRSLTKTELQALYNKHHKALIEIVEEQRYRDYADADEKARELQLAREKEFDEWFKNRGLSVVIPK